MGGFLHHRGDWSGRGAQRPSSLHVGCPCPQLTMKVWAGAMRTSENSVKANFGEFTFRNCLENSRRRLNGTSLAARVDRYRLLRPLFGAFVAPIWDPFRISKQFRKENSAKFAGTEFSEVRFTLPLRA